MAIYNFEKVNEFGDSNILVYNLQFQWDGIAPAFSGVTGLATVDGLVVGNADRDTAFTGNPFAVASNQLIDVSALEPTSYGKTVKGVRIKSAKGSANGWQDGANGFSLIDSQSNVYFTFPLKGDFNVMFQQFIASDAQTNANGDLYLRPILEAETSGQDVWNQSIQAQICFEKTYND